MARPRRASATLVIAAVAALLGGCGLFEPTATVPPVGGGSGIIANYTYPENCLLSMKQGLESKDEIGRQAYIGAFADPSKFKGVGFQATFDPAVLSAEKVLTVPDWDYELENTFYSQLLGLYSGAFLFTWSEDPYNKYDDEVGNEKTLHRHYLLQEIGDADTLVRAIGYADLTFRYIAPRWVLVRWGDRLDPAIGYDPVERTMGGIRLNPH